MTSQAKEKSTEILGSNDSTVPRVLPPELWHQVFDCLVQTPNGCQPIAFESGHVVTRTLHALTLVCHSIHPIASKYLYSYCVFVSCTRYPLFQSALLDRTRARLVPSLANTSEYNEDHDKVPAYSHNYVPYITSCVLDFDETAQIDFILSSIGTNLKRLVLDVDPASMKRSGDHCRTSPRHTLAPMSNLHELVISTATAARLEKPPPNLKRLALAGPPDSVGFVRHCVAQESLEMLVTERSTTMGIFYASFSKIGNGIDLVLVAENTRHSPLSRLEALFISKKVRVWEVDIPRSFYGDDDHDGLLYAEWVWMHAKQGTLWTQDKRRVELPSPLVMD